MVYFELWELLRVSSVNNCNVKVCYILTSNMSRSILTDLLVLFKTRSISVNSFGDIMASLVAACAVNSVFELLNCYSIFSLMCMFCRSLFVLFSFFCWSFCFLSFDLRIMITSLVSSNSSSYHSYICTSSVKYKYKSRPTSCKVNTIVE